AVYPQASLTPPVQPPATVAGEQWTADEALVEILRGRVEALGPVTVLVLADSFSLSRPEIEIALAKLEGRGFAMQGQFTPGTQASLPAEPANNNAGGDSRVPTECGSRRVLARIHRYTLH